MEWTDILMGLWNGLTAWIVLVVHMFGGWPAYPVYDAARGGNWYDFGFLVGAGSPFLGAANAGARNRVVIVEHEREPAQLGA
jgi:hypothetical protein